jgi:hypothetical protein
MAKDKKKKREERKAKKAAWQHQKEEKTTNSILTERFKSFPLHTVQSDAKDRACNGCTGCCTAVADVATAYIASPFATRMVQESINRATPAKVYIHPRAHTHTLCSFLEILDASAQRSLYTLSTLWNVNWSLTSQEYHT